MLVLLPILGSILTSRFLGLYLIKEKLSVTDYAIDTLDWKCRCQLCYINILKPFLNREMPVDMSLAPISSKDKKKTVVTVMSASESPI